MRIVDFSLYICVSRAIKKDIAKKLFHSLYLAM